MGNTKHAKEEVKTDAMNREITDGMNQLQVANEEDPFRRLPKQVMVNIISRQADLKSLCRYSLVSKHFARAISGVRTVSITLSGSVNYDEESLELTSVLLHAMQSFCGVEILDLLGKIDYSRQKCTSIQNLNLPKFLKKLTELESIHLDYQYQQNSSDYPFPMWKMNFVGGTGPKIESLVALVPAGPDSIRIDCCDREFLYGKEKCFAKASVEQMNWFWARYYGRYGEWLCLALILARTHIWLRRLTITDSGLGAKLVMEDKQLADFANASTNHASEELDNVVGNYIVRVAPVPILHLPLSGYVMRHACLIIIHSPGVDLCTSFEKLDRVMFGDSGDELERLREAVEEVFENHKEKIQFWGSHDCNSNFVEEVLARCGD